MTTPSRVLVPAQDDDASAAAVDRAAALAVALDAELILLALLPAPVLMPAYPSALAIAPDEVLGDREEIERMLATRVAAFSSHLPAGARTRWIHKAEPAGAAIVSAASEERADLIVVPMRRGSELSHVLRDGADRYVLHHSPVPVLVVPAA